MTTPPDTPLHTFSITSFQFEVKKGCWEYTHVDILEDGEKIGEYDYRYPSKSPPFYVFSLKNNWYALYATDYQCTRVMSLPDCKEVCKEETYGFCPVEFYVPVLILWDDVKKDCQLEYAPFGFVSGCVWGDDNGWKLEYLDLSQVDQNIIKREARFGYFELPSNIKLKDAINTDGIDKIENDKDVTIRLAKNISIHLDGTLLEWYDEQKIDQLKNDQLKEILKLYVNRGLKLTNDVIETFSFLTTL